MVCVDAFTSGVYAENGIPAFVISPCFPIFLIVSNLLYIQYE